MGFMNVLVQDYDNAESSAEKIRQKDSAKKIE